MYRSDILLSKYPFKLPPLQYPYDSLEPYIDEETVYYHHDKHFAGYVNNLNSVLKQYPRLQVYTLFDLLTRPIGLPYPEREMILRNAGGVYNHDEYFSKLAPAKSVNHAPGGRLLEMINNTFGSFDSFRQNFEKAAKDVFGSGWAMLCLTRQGSLRIVKLRNQDTVVKDGARPIVVFDVWEHGYYLKYKNDRASYISNLWNLVVFPSL